MKRLIIFLTLLASPAFAQTAQGIIDSGWGHDVGQIGVHFPPAYGTVPSTGPVSTGFTLTNSEGKYCQAATIAFDGKVTINRACLDKAADRCKPGTICEQWDAVARLLRAAINHNYTEIEK